MSDEQRFHVAYSAVRIGTSGDVLRSAIVGPCLSLYQHAAQGAERDVLTVYGFDGTHARPDIAEEKLDRARLRRT